MSDQSPPRRIRGHLTWERLQARLNGMREIWIATTDEDGRPHAVPVWFWWTGELLYFSTHPKSVKARNLARRPAVVAHNGDGVDPIILRGTAELVHDLEEIERVDAEYRAKYVDPGSGATWPLLGLGEVPAAVFRVRPHSITTWAHANPATRADWRFDSDERARVSGE